MAELTVDLLLEDAKFKRSLDNAVKAAKNSGQEIGDNVTAPIKSSVTSIGKLAGGLALGTLFVGAARNIKNLFDESLIAAQRQEDAVNSLNSALRRTREFTREASQDFQDFASSIQSTSVFGDEAILEQLAFAKSLGLTNEQTKEVVQAAVNLSAALGISLESSVRNVGKSFSGLTGELGELLPSIRTLSAEQLKAGEATRLINNQFAGAAQDQLKTYSGGVKSLSNAFGDFTESIGAYITQSDAVKSTTASLTGFFSELALKIKPTKTLSDQIKILQLDIADLREGISEDQGKLSLLGKMTPEANALRESISRSKEEMRGLLDELAKLSQAQEGEAGQTGYGPFQAIAEQAKAVKGLSEKELTELGAKIKELGLAQQAVERQRLDENLSILKTAFDNRIITEEDYFARRQELQSTQQLVELERIAQDEARIQEEAQKRQEALMAAQFDFQNFAANTDSIFGQLAKSFKVTNKDIANSLIQGIGNGAGNAFSAFGAALVNGENALDAFGKAFMAAIGQQAVALGTKFILEGAAITFSPTSGGPAVGVPLMAKGAALATFGGALGALSGGGGAQTSTSATSSTGSSIYEPSSDITTETATEREEPTTGVTINIQGDVFDTEETGIRLAKIFESASLNNNVRVVGGLS